ncbi:MAG TPA: hypothetical protein VHV83_15750 [Armatimonadota bacterium]|nr:hypothetical protein [Armatimonadota bacterium]
MCGLCGIVIGDKARRRASEIDALIDTFTRLLLASEHRGPHATGVAWVKRDGTFHVAKEPGPARTFVQSDAYRDWHSGIDRQVSYFMGHTRWPSRGNVRNAAENHPICAAPVLLTHNGTILDHRWHFTRLHLRRTTQVDSELLARIAQHHCGQKGIDVSAFLETLTSLDGSMSLALVAMTRPDEIILVKGNMPLVIRYHPGNRVLMYASESRIIDRILQHEAGWGGVALLPGEALVAQTAQLHASQRWPFTFQGMKRMVARQHFTGVNDQK